MKNVFNLFKNPKPKETKPMAVEVLGLSIVRAIAAYKKLQEAHAAAVAKILELDKKISDDAKLIAAYKVAMDETWPEDVGGSTGGVVG